MEFFNDVGSDPSRPSLFELVAQEQLRDLLQPALKYVLSIFATRYPRYLLRIVNKHEEFYAAIMLLVERHYLRKYSASFAENFYGLKRRRHPLYEAERTKAAVGGVPDEELLRERDIRRSLIFLIGLPYVRAKAQDYFEAIGGGVDPELMNEDIINRVGSSSSANAEVGQTPSDRFRKIYKKLYPRLNLTFEMWLICHNIAYLFDNTAFYRPWLRWINIDLRRLGAEDFQRMQILERQRKAVSIDASKAWRFSLRRLVMTAPRLLLDSLKVLLPTAIIFYKFLEWWYSPSSPARSMSAAPTGPAIPPPQMLKPHPQGVRFDPQQYGQCALCHQTIANATALPSGYVFCFLCAHNYVSEHGRCPVTLLPAQVWQLRKVLV